ncbi:hypothetical protein [Acetobacter orientalis]|uniref:hypothetical protein n=1 Tax=Acetobacter orientalis TaxID=146474 RepID=UPI0039E847FC
MPVNTTYKKEYFTKAVQTPKFINCITEPIDLEATSKYQKLGLATYFVIHYAAFSHDVAVLGAEIVLADPSQRIRLHQRGI